MRIIGLLKSCKRRRITMEVDDNVRDPNTIDYMVQKSLLAKNKLAIIIRSPEGNQYCCVQCSMQYTEKEELEVHLLTHNNEYRHLCSVCGTGLKRKEHMDRHMYEHQQVRPHVCDVCNKAFKRKEHLNIHRTIHTGDKTEVCVLCKKSFYRKDHLQKHLQTHGKHLAEQGMLLINENELLNIKAEIIDSDERSDDVAPSSDDADDMSRDALEVLYQGSIETVECDVGILDVPVKSEERPDRPFGCHLCEKNYKRKDHLKLHLQTHMAKDKICTECGKAFHRDDQLLAHMSIHTTHITSYVQDEKMDLHAYLTNHNMDPDLSENSLLRPIRMEPIPIDDRRHECTICHRKFKRRQHLKVHYNVHTKIQPNIWCSVCSQGFTSNSQFEAHNCPGSPEESQNGQESNANGNEPGGTLLDAKKENEYPLEIIPLEEPQRQEIQYIHDESAIPVPKIVYVCKYCNKPFKRKDHYKIHLHIHTGVKSFFCPDCGKGFYRKDHLQKHLQVHMKPKPKPKKAMPDLFPINMLPKKKEIKPEITIHAPSNTKLRVPLQIKVPYQMVMSLDNGEQSAFTVDPQSSTTHT